MKKYFVLMRVHQYIKNFLIFFPIFFSLNLLNWGKLEIVLISFLSFCLMCSSVYIINDIIDVEKDKLHPVKKNRPIASGIISLSRAKQLAVLLFLVSIILLYVVDGVKVTMLYLLMYFILNIAYSFKLKNIPILDIAILSFGFVIRLLFGAAIIGVSVSNWLYLTILSISFYLVLGKRRNELRNQGGKSRKVLLKYSFEFLDKNMYFCLTLGVIFYCLWCIDPFIIKNYPKLVYSIPIILLICLRYNFNIESSSFGDPVDVVLKDKVLLTMILIYGIIIFILFYGSMIKGFCV